VLSQAVSRIHKIRIVDPDVLHQPGLMELRAPRNQRGDQGRSHAASHIAHEIDDSGDRVVLLRRNSDVSHQRNRHEQESQTNHLGNAQPRAALKLICKSIRFVE
jgi:hypothetical protein